MKFLKKSDSTFEDIRRLQVSVNIQAIAIIVLALAVIFK